MKSITTERLLLREIVEGDIPDIYEYSKNENVGVNAGWKPHTSPEETAEISKQIFIGKEYIYGIVIKSKNKLIGSIGLMPDNLRENSRSRVIGFAIDEKYWGAGIMTESVKALLNFIFSETNVNIISATCYTDNPRSKRVLEKCGFANEGMLRQAEELYNGDIKDKYLFSVIKEEFTDTGR